jgi:hypothetical protein
MFLKSYHENEKRDIAFHQMDMGVTEQLFRGELL